MKFLMNPLLRILKACEKLNSKTNKYISFSLSAVNREAKALRLLSKRVSTKYWKPIDRGTNKFITKEDIDLKTKSVLNLFFRTFLGNQSNPNSHHSLEEVE